MRLKELQDVSRFSFWRERGRSRGLRLARRHVSYSLHGARARVARDCAFDYSGWAIVHTIHEPMVRMPRHSASTTI